MGRRIRIGLVVVVAFMAIVAAAAYAWDSSRSNQIAEGVSVSGVDVGGLSRAEAKRLLKNELGKPLNKPVVATYDGVRYKLNPARVEMDLDIDGMVQSAIDASRAAPVPERIWRDLTGGSVNHHIGVQVSYADEGLEAFIKTLESEVNRDAVDAEVSPSPEGLDVTESENGLELKTEDLLDRFAAALVRPDGRKFELDVEETEPSVTTDEVADEYPTYITVDRTNFKLRLWKDLEMEKEYPIAVGAIGMETPAGEYEIQNKAVDPAWHVPDREWAGKLAGKVIPGGDPRNALKARWMGIYDGAGIHGTDAVSSLGTAASHGCVRMDIPDVIELYELVEVGDPIYIG